MKQYNFLTGTYQNPAKRLVSAFWQKFHIDLSLLMLVLILSVMGLFILYSASTENWSVVNRQIIRLLLGLTIMIALAQIPPRKYYQWTPWLFGMGITSLVAVLIVGTISKGAQRWLDVGLFRLQPSEIMKLAVPMMVAYFLNNKILPPSKQAIFLGSLMFLIPALLTAKQPDLGTALIITCAGFCVLLLAGINWSLVGITGLISVVGSPILWHFLHAYQRQRVLTFLNPERDPLGVGYHIIQSKIAIGSGGVFGKGWLNGTQSHLQFLPEHATDFIFAVCGEELGLIGCIILLSIFLTITARCLYISTQAQNTYTRLLAGSLALTFFFSFFVNIGMVIGILPVVGLPLPLVSYGGTSLVTLMASFGIIMSIHTHRKLLGS